MSLYRTYRPQTFEDVSGQEHILTTLLNQLAAGNVAHAYLFTGPRGVGKTTIARLLAKAVNCLSPKGKEPCNACEACRDILEGRAMDVVEIDAASHTDVDHVRENIIKNVQFAPARLKRKVFIIDEAHMLSTPAFNALLKTLEEPPVYALFILATTEAHKVPQTIVSRCQRFDFRRLSREEIMERLGEIAKAEGAQVDTDVLEALALHSEGCARDAESVLEQLLGLGGKHISKETASLVLPMTSTLTVGTFLEAVQARDAKLAIVTVQEATQQGMDVPAFLDAVIVSLRERMLAALCGQLKGQDVGRIRVLIEVFLRARERAKYGTIPELAVELAVVELCCEGQQDREIKKDHEPQTVQPIPKKQEPEVKPLVEPEPKTTIQPKDTVLGSVPVLDMEEVKSKWPAVFEKIKECSGSLPMVVQAGELSAVRGNEVELCFSYELYADTINREKNRRMIEEIIGTVLGQTVRVHAKHVPEKKNALVDEIAERFGVDPAVSA